MPSAWSVKFHPRQNLEKNECIRKSFENKSFFFLFFVGLQQRRKWDIRSFNKPLTKHKTQEMSKRRNQFDHIKITENAGGRYNIGNIYYSLILDFHLRKVVAYDSSS